MIQIDNKIGRNALIEGTYFSLYTKTSIPFWATHVRWYGENIKKIEKFITKNDIELFYPRYKSKAYETDKNSSHPYLGILWKPYKKIDCSEGIIWNNTSNRNFVYHIMKQVKSGACYDNISKNTDNVFNSLERHKIFVKRYDKNSQICYMKKNVKLFFDST